MKKQIRVLCVPILLLLLFWHAGSGAAVQDLEPPDIVLKDISLGRFAFDAAHVVIDLQVHNPNSIDVVVESIRYRLTLNNTEVKQGSIQQEERFPARAKRAVRLPVSLAYNEHLPNILAVLRQPTSSHYEINGFVKIKGEKTLLPFAHKGPIVLPGMQPEEN